MITAMEIKKNCTDRNCSDSPSSVADNEGTPMMIRTRAMVTVVTMRDRGAHVLFETPTTQNLAFAFFYRHIFIHYRLNSN